MSRQKTHHTKQFKLDAINYHKEHPDLTQVECAKNLGIVSVLLLAGKHSSEIMTVIFPLSVPAVTLLMKRRKSPAFFISLTTNMPIGLYLSILKPFIIPLGFTATATICFLMILKNCLRGYLLCQQLSWQNFSFYFVLNLDTGPSIFNFTCFSPLIIT